MKTLLNLPKHITKVTLFVLGFILLLSVFTYGAVRQEQVTVANNAKAVAAAALSKQKDDTIKSLQKEVADAQGAAQATAAKLTGVCTAYKAVNAKIKTVAVPQDCVSTL